MTYRRIKKSELAVNNSNSKRGKSFDELDLKIASLLIKGESNKTISKRTNSPLSTIQRRTRKLFESGYLANRVEINYEKLGYHKGLVHLYLQGGADMKGMAEKLRQMKGIYNVGFHLGNSDLVGYLIFKENKEVLELIADVKKLEGVNRVIWSHEVSVLPGNYPQIFEELG